MSNITIIPYEGIEKVHFGDSRENTRSNLGNYKEFKKSKFSANTTDDFGFCHVFYTKDNKVDAIEFFPESELKFNNKFLFSLNYSELKSFLKDTNLEEDDTGAKFPNYGLSVYSPDLNKIETIMLYSKSYWEN
ncbi:MAG TPA: hypothetical protein DCZ76_04095 [Treponema sp.]|nr:hypothetical protein [Treponema sp.]